MRRATLCIGTGILLVATASVFGRELIRRVAPVGGDNVVQPSGKKLDFRLDAKRQQNGVVIVSLRVPPGGELAKASYYRLEIIRDGRMLLWTTIATRREADGTVATGFQIDESLAKDASIGVAYEGEAPQQRPMWAYRISVADYITEAQ